MEEEGKKFQPLILPLHPSLLSARIRGEKEGVKAVQEAAALKCLWEVCQERRWFCEDRNGEIGPGRELTLGK